MCRPRPSPRRGVVGPVLAGLLLVSLVLAGCASDGARDAGPRLVPRAPEERGVPAVEPPATVAEPYASLGDASPGFGTDAAPGEFPRVVRHALGDTTLAATPVRVVALDVPEVDSLVQLGLAPVGAVDLPLLPDHLVGAVAGTTSVGSAYALDLEAVASLEPDLILTNRTRHGHLYDELSAIAPTVVSERPGVAWQANVALHAQATGREAEAAAVVAVYERQVDELAALLPEPRPTVAVVRVLGDDLRSYLRANFPGVVLADLGLRRPRAQDVDDFAVDGSADELATHVQADLVVRSSFGADPTFLAALEADPAWQAAPAVVEGRILEVDDATWISGIGYGAIAAIHADLRGALADGGG